MRCVGVLGACPSTRTRKVGAAREACSGDSRAMTFISDVQQVTAMAPAMGPGRTSARETPLAYTPCSVSVFVPFDGLSNRHRRPDSLPPTSGAPWV